MAAPRFTSGPDEARALLEVILRKTSSVRASWCPHTPTQRQREFLDLGTQNVLEALFGGAAGGGKSDALLMDALRDVNVPGYSALMLRRTYPQLIMAGGLVPRSHEWLRNTEAKWNETKKFWSFPSGATISFGHLQHENDKYNYQGGEFQAVYFDELTQFTETQYRYLISRVRKLDGFEVNLRVRSASNPGGVGHDWVKKRFVDPDTRMDRVFVASSLDDNPHLDRDSYERSLKNLDATTYKQLRMGLWVRDNEGLVYSFNGDLNIADDVPHLPPDSWKYVLGVDLGASESKPTTAFVVAAFSKFNDTVWIMESESAAKMIPSTIAHRIKVLDAKYNGFERIVVDHGALGRGYIGEFRNRYQLAIEDAEKSSKLGFIKLMNGDMERARVRVVSKGNEGLIDEYNTLPWDKKGLAAEKHHANHMSDAALYAWRACRAYLAKEQPRAVEDGSTEWYMAAENEMRQRRQAAMKAKKAPPDGRVKSRKERYRA